MLRLRRIMILMLNFEEETYDKDEFVPMYLEYNKELHQYAPEVDLLSENQVEKWFCEYKMRKDTHIYHLMQDGKTAGFLIVGDYGNTHPDTDLYIQELYVRPEYRKMGIADRMIRKLIRTNPYRYCLFILDNNIPAKMFWNTIFAEQNIKMLLLTDDNPLPNCTLYGFKVV